MTSFFQLILSWQPLPAIDPRLRWDNVWDDDLQNPQGEYVTADGNPYLTVGTTEPNAWSVLQQFSPALNGVALPIGLDFRITLQASKMAGSETYLGWQTNTDAQNRTFDGASYPDLMAQGGVGWMELWRWTQSGDWEEERTAFDPTTYVEYEGDFWIRVQRRGAMFAIELYFDDPALPNSEPANSFEASDNYLPPNGGDYIFTDFYAWYEALTLKRYTIDIPVYQQLDRVVMVVDEITYSAVVSVGEYAGVVDERNDSAVIDEDMARAVVGVGPYPVGVVTETGENPTAVIDEVASLYAKVD